MDENCHCVMYRCWQRYYCQKPWTHWMGPLSLQVLLSTVSAWLQTVKCTFEPRKKNPTSHSQTLEWERYQPFSDVCVTVRCAQDSLDTRVEMTGSAFVDFKCWPLIADCGTCIRNQDLTSDDSFGQSNVSVQTVEHAFETRNETAINLFVEQRGKPYTTFEKVCDGIQKVSMAYLAPIEHTPLQASGSIQKVSISCTAPKIIGFVQSFLSFHWEGWYVIYCVRTTAYATLQDVGVTSMMCSSSVQKSKETGGVKLLLVKWFLLFDDCCESLLDLATASSPFKIHGVVCESFERLTLQSPSWTSITPVPAR